jgi:hypothetical protein
MTKGGSLTARGALPLLLEQKLENEPRFSSPALTVMISGQGVLIGLEVENEVFCGDGS